MPNFQFILYKFDYILKNEIIQKAKRQLKQVDAKIIEKILFINIMDPNYFDVIIIGGGIAGVAAAYELQCQLNKNKQCKLTWALLQVSDKLGGRLQSIYFNGRRVDTGGYQLASYGQKKTHNNQLYKLIKQGFCKIKHRQGTGKVYYYDDQSVIYNNQSISRIQKTLQKFENQSQGLIKKNKNISVKQCLDIFIQKGGIKNLNQSELKLFNLELHLMEQQQAGQIQDLSAEFMFGQFQAQEDNLDDYPLPIDTYHGLFQQFTKTLPHKNIHLKRNVVSVQRIKDQTIIIAQITNKQQKNQSVNYQHYKCKYTICAVPLGVIKKKRIKFVPNLPKQHQLAIQGIGYGRMQKVFLAFQEPFWKKDMLGLKIASSNRINFPYFTNLSGRVAGKQEDVYILCGFITGSTLKNNQKHQMRNQLIEDAVNILKKAFAGKQIKLKDAYLTNWSNQKYIQGAYSYITPKCTYKQLLQLRKSIKNYLWFAGEYLYFQNQGCAHGAFATGSRAAKQILKTINNSN